MSQLFNSDSDRELWIKLNAERQIEWEKGLVYFDSSTQTYKPTQQALNPRCMEQALVVARNQCEYDEKKGKLRYTIEELLTCSREELIEIQQKDYRENWLPRFK